MKRRDIFVILEIAIEFKKFIPGKKNLKEILKIMSKLKGKIKNLMSHV
jgi:hypothetical protein